MGTHVIVGAGAIGSGVATRLVDMGHEVRLVTRRGTGPSHNAIERVAADATDADRLSRLATGADALFNCANPEYHQWFRDWPPLHRALLTAAENSGATLVTMSNLYGYGPVTAPMTEQTPLAATHPKLKLRADMWREALALHDAGRIRATEVRASDYIEANSLLSYALGKSLLSGKRTYSPAPLDVLHSWTSVADATAALVTVATNSGAWGRAWHAPTNAPQTVRQMATRFAEVNGAPPAKLTAIPYAALWTVGLFDAQVKELRATRYQFTEPFVLDSSAIEQAYGLQPTPMDEALRRAGAALR
jgi:nucleoside-diphosphate-sugar epimerase